MSHSSYNQKLYPQDDIQFKILSQSHQPHYNKQAQNTLLQSLQGQNHRQLNQVVVMQDDSGGSGGGDIFNDANEGGGVDPSINESIRQSIQCSFVSSEYGEMKQKYQQETSSSQQEALRNNYVMNRMNWITYLKVLFDQLEQFNQNKQKHVETANFLKGLKKIKNLLPLQTRNDYYKHCSEVAFTYKEVENGVSRMPKYITWDNVIDIFLSKQATHQITQNPIKAVASAFKQVESNKEEDEREVEFFKQQQQHPQQINESHFSDGIDYELSDVEQAYNSGGPGKNSNKQSNVFQTHSSAQKKQGSLHQQLMKTKKTEDLFPSFALDSFVNHGNLTNNNDYNNNSQQIMRNSQQQNHILAQAPLLMGNPNLGLKDKDDDEACEIDSEYSNSMEGYEDGEESKNQSVNSRRRKQGGILEESIRSSRTATFKSVRRMSTALQNANNTGIQSSITSPIGAVGNVNLQGSQQQLNSALSAAINVQDSYYAAIKNSSMPQNYQQPSNTQKFIYYQQQSQQKIQLDNQSRRTSISKNESRNNSIQFLDNEDGQVELASNNSFGSSSRWKSPVNQNAEVNQSIKVEMLEQINNQNMNNNNANEKGSTRISSLNSNSLQKNLNQNNTILSQNSSQSSQSQQKMQNNSKVSIISSSQHSNQTTTSNFFDLDEQGKQLKTYEINTNRNHDNKKQLRSVNFSINQLTKLPLGLEKSIQFMNISYNKLKSLNGIEVCINLKFLNVAGNQISSASNLILLQSMRELIFAHNQLSLLKEIGQLKNIQLLDLSSNKIIEFEKLTPLQSLKKLNYLSLQGNLVQKINNYEQLLNKLLPTVKVKDPFEIKDFTSFQDMEHICFTDPPQNLSQISNSMMIVVEQQMINTNGYNSAYPHQINRDYQSAEKANENLQQIIKQTQPIENKSRSKTPNKEKNSKFNGVQSQLKQQFQTQDNRGKKDIHILSPQKNEIELKNAAAGQAKRLNANQTNTNKVLQTYNTTQNFSMAKNNIGNQNQNPKINTSATAYNETQFRLQNKFSSTGGSVNSVQIQSQKSVKSTINNNNHFAIGSDVTTPRGNGGTTQRNNQGPTLISRDRSYTQEDKSKTRDRSNNSDFKNNKIRNQLQSVGANNSHSASVQSVQASGRSTINNLQQQQQHQQSFNSTLQSQNTFQSVKEPQVKKISLNTNIVQQHSSIGKITPRMKSANNNQNQAQSHFTSFNQTINSANKLKIQTPRNEKTIKISNAMNQNGNNVTANTTAYYKKSFCTDEETSVYQNLHNDLQNTPSEKNTVRTAPTQESSSQKLKQITKQNEILIQQNSVSSPNPRLVKANLQTQSRNSNMRPVTTLKQRVVATYKNDFSIVENPKLNNTSFQNSGQINNNINGNNQVSGGTVNSQLHQMLKNGVSKNNMAQFPQTTKNQNQNFSHSFIFDDQVAKANNIAGRQTPTRNNNISVQSVYSNSQRPSSQLQKFINASNKPLAQAAQQQQRPSQSQMSFHVALPSQKLTNLPPKAYQLKSGNPGDKKSKADMSLSMISSQNNIQNHSQFNINNNLSSVTNPLNTNSSYQLKNQNSVLQTGGSMPEEDHHSHTETLSSRSMSPVLEESNNIKKLKVDLTQYMNKQ